MSGMHMKIGGGGGGFGGAQGAQGQQGGSGQKIKGGSGGHVPPGLADKPGGMPPGQYKKWHDGFDQQSGGGLLGGLLGGQGSLLDLSSLLGGTGASTPTAVNGTKNAPSTALPNPTALPSGAAAAPTSGKAPDLPYINQYDPAGKDSAYTNGAENCGPDVLAMIAKSKGLEGTMTDAQLVTKEQGIAGTTAQGTSGNGMIAGLQAMGMQTAAAPGADLNWINNQLAAGHEVISNGDFYSVPGHTDPNLVAGHYIAVTGFNGTNYNVTDPADPNVHTMTAQQLQTFIAAHPDGGFSIAAW